MIEQGHRRQDAGADRGHAIIRRGFRNTLRKAGCQLALLGFTQQLLAPVKDQGQLAEVLSLWRSRAQGPGDGFAPRGDIARNLVIERLGEGAFGQRSVRRNVRVKLLPRRSGALPFPLQQPQPGGPEKEPWVVCKDDDWIGGPGPRDARLLGKGERETRRCHERGRQYQAHPAIVS